MSQIENDSIESEMFDSRLDWEKVSEYSDFVLLHRGNYADTFRAQKAGKYFLVKAPKDINSVSINMLKREYEISLNLSHPNIASVVTFEHIDGVGPTIVMEYIDGVNLRDFLKSNPSVKVRSKILNQLLAAVGYMHLHNIIHNDLKPENILISRRGFNLKLIDFGLSDDDAHYLSQTLGCTPEYASPELLSRSDSIDVRSDIWSIGKIISIIFPNRYTYIARKCCNNDKSKRYADVAAIEMAIIRQKISLWALPIVLLLVLFVPIQIVDIVSDRKAARVKMHNEHIIDDAIARYKSLFSLYEQKIGEAPYDIFGSAAVVEFVSKFEATADSIQGAIIDQSYKEKLYIQSERIRNEMVEALSEIAQTRPQLDELNLDEINFYIDLVTSGKPYEPYRR